MTFVKRDIPAVALSLNKIFCNLYMYCTNIPISVPCNRNVGMDLKLKKESEVDV